MAHVNGTNGGGAAPSKRGPLRCGLYVRVSTDRQAAQEFSSLDAQEDVLRQLVAAKNAGRPPGEPEWTIASVFREKASAKDTNRPEFQRLLKEIEGRRIDMVIFIRLDRFSRSLRDFLDLQDFLREHGCGYVSKYDPMLDTSSPHGEFIVRLLLLLAEYERKLTGARTKEKIMAARQRGRWTGGYPALGYNVSPDSGKLVVNAAEAEEVHAIFSGYLEHRSLIAVVQELNRRGSRSKSWVTKSGTPHEGRPWSKTTLRRLLSNPVYVGQMPCQGKAYPAEHEPIVPEATFRQVQELLSEGRTRGSSSSRNKYKFLLRGLVRCEECGTSMTPSTTKKRNGVLYRYYACVSAQKRGKDACAIRSVPAAELERVVVDELRKLGRDADLADEMLQEAERSVAASRARLKEEARRLQAEERRIKAQAGRVFASKATGTLAAGHLAELEERQGQIAGRLVEIETESQRLAAVKIDPDEAKRALALFDPVWDVLESKERERLVRLVVERVVYDGLKGEIAVQFHPLGLKSLATEAAPTTAKLKRVGRRAAVEVAEEVA